MAHTTPISIGPSVTIHNKRYHWFLGALMDDSFNKIAELETTYDVAPQVRRYTLIIYSYKDGYRYKKKTQVLPMAADYETAQRMAVPILNLLLEN